jgi:DNA-binding NtrC family response regulator
MTTGGRKRGRILVVDDDDTIRDLLADVLGQDGFSVRTASSGERAPEVLATDPGQDVVVTDLRMPGMDGAAFMRRLHEQARSVPIILATGDSDTSTASHPAAIAPVAVLRKPFALRELVQAIDRALAGPATPPVSQVPR